MAWDPKSISSVTENKKLSRRGFLEKSITGMALASTATLSAWALIADAEAGAHEFSSQGKPKVSKVSARYQDNPNKGRQCSGCVHFLGPSDCAIVNGHVNPEGWCRHFKAKGGKKGAAPKRT
jgi:hypothetical protein